MAKSTWNIRASIILVMLSSTLIVGHPLELLAQDSRVTLEGQGDDLTSAVDLESGLLMVGGAYRGDGNFIVQLITTQGDLEDVVFNAIGEYGGVRMLPIDDGAYRFQVQASAPWVLMYEQVDQTALGTPLPVAEQLGGDAPLGPIALEAGLLEATFTHDGEANFIVMLYQASGQLAGVLVNDIGSYSGTVGQRVSEAGVYYLAVQADGEWSVSLSMN